MRSEGLQNRPFRPAVLRFGGQNGTRPFCVLAPKRENAKTVSRERGESLLFKQLSPLANSRALRGERETRRERLGRVWQLLHAVARSFREDSGRWRQRRSNRLPNGLRARPLGRMRLARSPAPRYRNGYRTSRTG